MRPFTSPALLLTIGVLAALELQTPAADSPRKPRVDLLGDPLPDGVLSRMGSGRLRHGVSLNALAFSPDGKSLVSAGEYRLRVWDVATGKLRWQSSFESYFISVAFSADSAALTCAGAEKIAVCRIFDVRNGKKSRRIDLPSGIAPHVPLTVSPGGKLLAVARQPDNTVRLYDTANGKEVRRIKTERSVNHVAFAPDGKTMALADNGDTIHLHDTANGKRLGECQRKDARFARAFFAPDGRSLAITDSAPKGGIRIWDLTERKERCLLKDTSRIYNFTFSQDGKLLAAGKEAKLFLWETTTGKQVRHCDVRASLVAFHPDGKTLAAATVEGTITFWDVATGRLLPPSTPPIGTVHELRFLDGGKQLLGIAETVLLWDASTGRELRRRIDTRDSFSTALSLDGTLLAASTADQSIQLWDVTSGKRGPTIKPAEAMSFLGWFCFSSNGRRVHGVHVNATKQPLAVTIRTYDATTGREVSKMTSSGRMANLMAVSPDGRWLATGSSMFDANYDKAIRLWDLTAGREARAIPIPDVPPNALAFSPDSKRLAAVGSSQAGVQGGRLDAPGLIRIWDVASGDLRRTFQGHKEMARCVDFSPDGRMLATGGYDRSVRLWELASGRQRHEFRGHEGNIESVAFSADGRRLAASSPDAPVYIWDVNGSTEQTRQRLSEIELRRCWSELASDDAAVAFQAIRRLIAVPEQTLPILRQHLKPVPAPDIKHVRQLVKALDSDEFKQRETATKELEKLADAAASTLRQIIAKEKPSLEVRRTLQQILDSLATTPESLRSARAVEVLECIATPDAVRSIDELAKGAADGRLTREAIAASERLHKMRR